MWFNITLFYITIVQQPSRIHPIQSNGFELC